MVDSTEWLLDLHERGILFLRDPSYRVLHVVSPGRLREATIRVVANLGNRPEARGPVLVVDAANGEGSSGWGARARQLRQLASELEGEARELDPESEEGGLRTFAEQLVELTSGPTNDGEEVVIALVPAPIRARDRWNQAISVLLGSDVLGSVRWVIVEVDTASSSWRHLPDGAVLLHGPAAGTRPEAPLGAVLQRSLARPDGWGAAPAGAVPPPRGMGPRLEDQRVRSLASHIIAACTAMGDKRTPEAVEHLCRARDLAVDDHRMEQAVIMELVLAGHLLAASAATQAILSCERAVTLAKETEVQELSAIALLTLGTCRMGRGDRPGALVAFAEGAACADQSPSVPLLLEACRLTGEVALELGLEGQAVSFWARAVKRAKEDPSQIERPSRTAARCALLLEQLCKKRGVELPAKGDARVAGAVDSPVAHTASARTERLREWTSEERHGLRQSWSAIVDQDTTSLLSPGELASIHGWKDLPPPRLASSATVALPSSGSIGFDGEEPWVEGTELLDPEELAAIRRRLHRNAADLDGA